MIRIACRATSQACARRVHKNAGWTGIKSLSSIPDTVVYTWGVGTNGQLGHQNFSLTTGVLESYYVQETPRKLLRSSKFKDIYIGESCTFGIDAEGKLYAWGSGYLGEKDQSNEPTLMPLGGSDIERGSGKIISVSAGTKHYAAVDSNGLVYTWGKNGDWMRGAGQLGHGNTDHQSRPKLVEFLKKYDAKAVSVSCGGQHTVILTDDGEVLTCGVGEYGRLGTGNTNDSHVPMPVDAFEDEIVVQIAAGLDHSLALTEKGVIYSWGRNQMGQLGHADSYIDIYSMEDFPTPVHTDATGGLLFKSIASGNSRSAAVSQDGRLFVWGARVSVEPKLFDRDLFDGLSVTQVAIGGDSSKSVVAVVTQDGGLWTLGDGSSHMMGNPGKKSSAQPVRVEALQGRVVRSVKGGFGMHMAAIVEVPSE